MRIPGCVQIACPICKSSLREEADFILCEKCGRKFVQTNDKFINLFPEDKLKDTGFGSWQKRQSIFLGWVRNIMNEALAQEAKNLYDEFAQYVGNIEGITLDVGCADGQFNSHFKKTRYIGLDPYEGWVINKRPDYMKKIFPVDEDNLIFVKGLGEYLPFADAAFDNVIISNALDHSSHPYDMLREATRVLRHNGRLYLMHENPAFLNKLKRKSLGDIYRMIKRKLKGLIFTGTINSPHIRLDKENLEGQLRCGFVFESKFSRNKSHMLYSSTKKSDNR